MVFGRDRTLERLCVLGEMCNAGQCPMGLVQRARDVIDHALVIDAAKREERDVIVAWLRAANLRPAFMDPHIIRAFGVAADLIERGEHLVMVR